MSRRKGKHEKQISLKTEYAGSDADRIYLKFSIQY